MSDSDMFELNNLICKLNVNDDTAEYIYNQRVKDLEKQVEDLKMKNKMLDETNEFLIKRNDYLLDKNEYLIEINKKNEYLELKIKDFVELEIENEAWRNGYADLIKQYDSDFSLTYLKNRNEELENKVKILENEIGPLKIANKDFETQNRFLESKIKTFEKPKDIPKPAHIKRIKTDDNKNPVLVKPFIRDWVKYYKSSDNILYDRFGYLEGMWDISAKKIVTFSEEEMKRHRRPEKLQILL